MRCSSVNLLEHANTHNTVANPARGRCFKKKQCSKFFPFPNCFLGAMAAHRTWAGKCRVWTYGSSLFADWRLKDSSELTMNSTKRFVLSLLLNPILHEVSYLESSFKSQGSKFLSWKLGFAPFRGAQITLIRSSPASKRFKRHSNSIMNSGI